VEGGDRRVLDPVERVSEILFGLIMVLTFTGSMSVATAGREEVSEMLIGAVGCNLAWGIVDAVMYLLTSLVNRGRGLLLLQAVRKAERPEKAHGIIASALPPTVASLMQPSDFESMRQGLVALPAPALRPRLNGQDLRGAMEVFLLVFLSTFPVVIPFLLISTPSTALRVSNAVAVTMLFVGGISLGRFSGLHSWALGLALAALGAVLVAITIALGG
jgi:hypothetical protein